MHEILFTELLKNFTEYDFHDAHIKSIEYNYDEDYILFTIEHYRELGDDEIEVISILKFFEIDDVMLVEFSNSKHVSLFFTNSEIASFSEEVVNEKKMYDLVTIRWRLNFSAEKIEYTEV